MSFESVPGSAGELSQGEPSKTGTATFVDSDTVAVTFTTPYHTGMTYSVLTETRENETFWVTNKSVTGFTLNSNNAVSTATIGWMAFR